MPYTACAVHLVVLVKETLVPRHLRPPVMNGCRWGGGGGALQVVDARFGLRYFLSRARVGVRQRLWRAHRQSVGAQYNVDKLSVAHVTHYSALFTLEMLLMTQKALPCAACTPPPRCMGGTPRGEGSTLSCFVLLRTVFWARLVDR